MVRAEFGDETASLVSWVTKGPDEDKQAYLIRLADAPDRVVWLKLADRVSNVRRLDTHPRKDKRARYYDETVNWMLPLADRHSWFAAWFAEWREQFRWLSQGAE